MLLFCHRGGASSPVGAARLWEGPACRVPPRPATPTSFSLLELLASRVTPTQAHFTSRPIFSPRLC